MIKLTCEKCKTVYDIDQPHPYHAGFSELGFLYCNKCPNVLIWNIFDPIYAEITEKKVFRGHFPKVETFEFIPPWELEPEDHKSVENALKPCPCGGQFKFENKLLCLKCQHPLAGSILDTIYYYKLGKEIYGGKTDIWKKEPLTFKSRAGGMDYKRNNSKLIEQKNDLICKYCNNSYKVNFYHAGFGDVGYLYCNKCTTVVIWGSITDRRYNEIIKGKHPWMLETYEHKLIEDLIKPCPCGGEFKFKNKLLCPTCKKPLADNILNDIYYYIIDKKIDGLKYNIWKKKDYWKKEPPTYES